MKIRFMSRMSKIILIAVFGASFIFTPQTAEATNGMKLIGYGPIQRSMGGVSIALPLDTAVIMSNPAGMFNVGRRVDFGMSIFYPNVKYKATATPSTGAVASDGTTFGSNSGPSPIPAFGLVLPLNDYLTFGIGAYGIAGMGVDFAANLYNNVTFSKYTLMKFSPGMAYNFKDKIQFGITLNMAYATMDYYAGSHASAPAMFFPQEPHQGGSAFGWGATIGILWKINDMFSTGIAYETKLIFPDFEFNTVDGRDKLDFDQPQNLAWGFAAKPIKGLIAAFDFVWINWPQTNGPNQPAYTQNSSGAAPWNMNWDNQFVYKLGIQWAATEKAMVRTGFNYGKSPLNTGSAFEGIAFPAIAEWHITFGGGYQISKAVAVNVGLVYAPTVTQTFANDAQFINSAEVKMWQLSGEFGIACNF